MVLTVLQLDAMTELVNLGVGHAALSLHDMVREEILLCVPKVAVLTRAQAVDSLGERQATNLVAIQQDFAGALKGRAMLVFPEVKSMELVRAIVGGDLPVEEIMEIEQEALAETGNILLNACLTTIANSLEHTLTISLPEVVHGETTDFVPLTSGWDDDCVLFISIQFALKHRSINGCIAMLLDLLSMRALKDLLDIYINRSAGVLMLSAP